MARARRDVCVFMVFITIFPTYLFYIYTTEVIPPSTWTCNGTTARNTICEFTNFCVDQQHGPFIISNTDDKPPSINMINADESEDVWFSPQVRTSSAKRGLYVDDTLFVYGLYSPYHFSHYVYNGLLPLYSTIREYAPQGAIVQWILRAKTYGSNHITFLSMEELGIPEEHDILIEPNEALTQAQRVPPKILPLCFARAIVGTGNRCPHWYCERNIPREDYTAFRQTLQQVSIRKSNPCLNSIKSYGNGTSLEIVVLNRDKTRHITNMPDVIEALLHEFIDVSINHVSFDEGCDMRSTAYLVERADVLIAPFGNGLGSGLFMKEGAIVISIDARWYSEDWFYYPLMPAGVRLYTFGCKRELCQEFDETLIKKLAPNLTDTERIAVMTQSDPPFRWSVVQQYRKDAKRRVDIERFIPFLKERLYTEKPYEDMCGSICQPALQRYRNHH